MNSTILADTWTTLFVNDAFNINASEFWVLPFNYSNMPPKLYSSLEELKFLFLKGDMHFRKLTGDKNLNPQV